MKKYSVSLLLCAVMAVSFCAAAFSAGFSLPVEVQVSGSATDADEEYTIVLEAESADCPMPDGSAEGSCVFSVSADETVMLPEIDFTQPGVYGYSIYQIPGMDDECTYDGSVFSMTVYAEQNGDGLYLAAVVRKSEDGAKLEKIVFINEYEKVTSGPTDKPENPDNPGMPLTGVRDHWMFYIGGAALLLVIAGIMAFILARRSAEEDE